MVDFAEKCWIIAVSVAKRGDVLVFFIVQELGTKY